MHHMGWERSSNGSMMLFRAVVPEWSTDAPSGSDTSLQPVNLSIGISQRLQLASYDAVNVSAILRYIPR